MGCTQLTRWSFVIGLVLLVIGILDKGLMMVSKLSLGQVAPRAFLFAGAVFLLVAIANEACAAANARMGQKAEK